MRSSRMRDRRARASGWSTTVSCTRDTVAARQLREGRIPPRLTADHRAPGDALDGAAYSTQCACDEYRRVRTETSARPYESSLRRAQAEGTRTAVLDAAAALFVREGYLRTTMKAIAAEAGTSVETVYAQGSKTGPAARLRRPRARPATTRTCR